MCGRLLIRTRVLSILAGVLGFGVTTGNNERRLLVVLAGAILVAGCGGGQTGDLSGQNDKVSIAGDEDGCADESQDISLGDDTALGFSADSVLAFAARPPAAHIEWQAVEGVEYTPGPSQSTLTLVLTASGAARFVHSFAKPLMVGSDPDFMPFCRPDRLEIPVHGEVASADGALFESFEGTLEAADSQYASLRQAFAIEALHGSFKLQSLAPGVLHNPSSGTETRQFILDTVLSQASLSGAFDLQAKVSGTHLLGASTLTFGLLQ